MHIQNINHDIFLMKKYGCLKILLRCVIRKTEEVNEDSTDEWLQCDACEVGFQHVTDTYIVSTATKQRGGKQGQQQLE
jgi:hypothetical protein